jgi:glycosyltransferase involved in cell wall biosynthesis
VRILNVIGSVEARNGGTTHHVFASSRVWGRHGHQCHVLCLDPPDADCVARSSLVTFALGPRGEFHVRLSQLFPFLKYGYTPALGRWLRANAENYDAIILNGLWNFTSYGTWLALRNSSVPYYVCPHGMLDPWLKEARPARHFLRTVFWSLFERKVLRDAGGVFFASEEERRLAGQSFLQRDSHSYVVGYGTEDVRGDPEDQKSAFLSRFPQLRGRRLILFLGRVHPKKGLDVLVKAFARVTGEFPAFDLVVAGPDDMGMRQQLTNMASHLGVSGRIHWTGMLSGDQKSGAFLSSDFFALPSHQENFGIAVVEAMAAAVPVLISKKVNIWREVQSSGGGHAVMDNVGEVVEGLKHMCRLSPRELAIMKENARNCFCERFNIENNAAELASLMIKLGKPTNRKAAGHASTSKQIV